MVSRIGDERIPMRFQGKLSQIYSEGKDLRDCNKPVQIPFFPLKYKGAVLKDQEEKNWGQKMLTLRRVKRFLFFPLLVLACFYSFPNIY